MDFHKAYLYSKELLQQAVSPKGYLASTVAITNYQRIWARDSIICGLAALLTEEKELIKGLKETLITLAQNQTAQGHIPSNVAVLANKTEISLGGLCGRVDTIPWFVIGVCNYVHFTGDTDFAKQMLPSIDKALFLLKVWEFNNRGLLFVPRSGDWADEYILNGYVLYDQVLRLWALSCYASIYKNEEVAKQVEDLRGLLQQNYWLSKNAVSSEVYHPNAYQVAVKTKGESNYWSAGFEPGGYFSQFDLQANAFSLLLNLGTEEQSQKLMDYTEHIRQHFPLRLIPSFYPVIDEKDRAWLELQNNFKYEFRNLPYEFHNGGSWTVWNGFFGAALVKHSALKQAESLLIAIHQANQLNENQDEEWGFFENFHSLEAKPIGTKYCTWSAAGAIILQQAFNGKHLFLG